jgi:hypothetical protein
VNAKELECLLEEVEAAAEAAHVDGRHCCCGVCPVANVINKSDRIIEETMASIMELVLRGDPSGMCVLLASFFAAGELHATERATQAVLAGKCP